MAGRTGRSLFIQPAIPRAREAMCGDVPSSTSPKFIGGTILAMMSRRRSLAVVGMGDEQDECATVRMLRRLRGTGSARSRRSPPAINQKLKAGMTHLITLLRTCNSALFSTTIGVPCPAQKLDPTANI